MYPNHSPHLPLGLTARRLGTLRKPSAQRKGLQRVGRSEKDYIKQVTANKFYPHTDFQSTF